MSFLTLFQGIHPVNDMYGQIPSGMHQQALAELPDGSEVDMTEMVLRQSTSLLLSLL